MGVLDYARVDITAMPWWTLSYSCYSACCVCSVLILLLVTAGWRNATPINKQSIYAHDILYPTVLL